MVNRRATAGPLFAALIVVCFCGFCAQGRQQQQQRVTFGEAGSTELSIVAAKVQMLLIASDGKKTGLEAKSKKILKEIPNSAYYQDALLEYDSGRVDPNTTQTINVKQAMPGKYRLIVSPGTAADGEEFEIRVNLYLHGGGEARAARIAGTAKRGKVAMYELRVSAEPANVTIDAAEPTRSVSRTR